MNTKLFKIRLANAFPFLQLIYPLIYHSLLQPIVDAGVNLRIQQHAYKLMMMGVNGTNTKPEGPGMRGKVKSEKVE